MSALPSAPELQATPAREASGRWLRRLATLLALVAIAEDLDIVYLGTSGDHRFTLDLSLTTFGFLGTVLTFPLSPPICGLSTPSRRPGASQPRRRAS